VDTILVAAGSQGDAGTEHGRDHEEKCVGNIARAPTGSSHEWIGDCSVR
jgi:hypothetical protein